MKASANHQDGMDSGFLGETVLQPIHGTRFMAWMGHPAAYAIGAVIVTILSLGTSLMAPALLGPAAFGAFSLLTSLFQYAGTFDLGLSQLADRDIAANASPAAGRGQEILRANWAIGGIILGVVMPISCMVVFWSGMLSVLDTALAISAGALFLISNAPVTIYRASGQIMQFTLLALLLQLGMTAPRLFGLMTAGATGCFIMLVIWYGVLAFLTARPKGEDKPIGSLSFLPLWRAALPLFAFNLLWLVYLTTNRWISAFLSSPEELGYFAFASNLSFTGVGMLATIAQVRYPKILSRISQSPRGSCSNIIEREIFALSVLLFVGALGAAFVLQPIVRIVFPSFESAIPSVIAIAIASVSLGIFAWIFPIVVALSPMPGRHAALMFIPMFIILTVAMVVGHRWDGITGQAWGCMIAAFTLIAGLVALIYGLRIIRGWAAIRILAWHASIIGGLITIVFATVLYPTSLRAALYDRGSAPPAGWRLAFEENFNTLRLWGQHPDGIWEPHYPWGDRTNATNRELQYYVDPRPGRDSADIMTYDPFSIASGSLVIRARPFPRNLAPQGLRYASGLLTTARTFSFTYGYVEMRARVPRGRGLWPAFWLAPTDRSWPPEIDVMEVLGHDTRSHFVTFHTRVLGFHSQGQVQVKTPDLSIGFHTYAMKWTADEIVWYLDGQVVAVGKTPKDMHKPMYILVNLAVGGNWPGSPDEKTRFPADFYVDRIRAFLPPTR